MALETIRLFVLEDYDGGDGRCNRPNGVIVRDKALADHWASGANSYREITGIIAENISEIKEAMDERDRVAALRKLSAREKKLLGLSE